MRLDMADVRPSLMSFFIVGMMATLFIVGGKYVSGRWQIPGFSQLMRAA